MKRTNCLFLVALAILASSWISAQTLTNITIGTTSTANYGPVFVVDGVSYLTTQTFTWPACSSHVVQFPFSVDQNGNAVAYQSVLNDSVRFSFGGWQENTGLLSPVGDPILTITAQPGLTSLIANVTASYEVTINFPNGGSCTGAAAPGNPGSIASMQEGVVYFNGSCVSGGTTIQYLAAGAYTVNAFPYPGWVFYGWLVNNLPNNALASLNITNAVTLTPQFSLAKRVDFLTNPLGLQVLVDGTPINTPNQYAAASDGVSCAPDYSRLPSNAPPGFVPLCYGQFDFLPGSVHRIGAPTPQTDSTGTVWVFSAFSNGMTENANYTAGMNTGTPDVLTADFIPGVHATVQTNPQGLKILIDGRDNWPNYTFTWGQGTTHTLVAESPQTDASGRIWQFANWSDNGAASHTITAPTSSISYYVTATYTELQQVTINSSPSGLNFTIDGNACTTPCVVNKAAGSTSQVVAPSSVPFSGGSQYSFLSWSDGNTSPSRTITYSQNTLTLTANYQTSYQITAVSNPANAATFTISPASPSGYYASGTQVQITAVAANGYKFVKWEGNLSGSSASGILTMNSPQAVQADMLSVPFIAPAGIETAAGPTPDGSVAPGSLISIYGSNLAPAFQLGPSNPLAQAIGNVTVTVSNYIMPLVFVSPTQISAQVPWELAPGTYTLTIQQTGQPDVPGTFTVSRDAPAIFTQANAQNLPLAVALHQDGTVVNFQSPVIQGEQITIYGTGFGPYNPRAANGFATPPTQNPLLIDPALVTIGSVQLQPDFAGSEPGLVGVAIVKVTIVPGTPTATNANLTITVNGKPSAQAVLPMQ